MRILEDILQRCRLPPLVCLRSEAMRRMVHGVGRVGRMDHVGEFMFHHLQCIAIYYFAGCWMGLFANGLLPTINNDIATEQLVCS